MTATNHRVLALALAISGGWVLPAQAQSRAELSQLQAQIETMQQQVQAMQQQIASLQGALADANAKAGRASEQAEAATAALAKAPAPTVTAKPATEVTWDGAPKLATKDGWSFKPRGRLQFDAGNISAPVANSQSGLSTRVRRAFIGFDGTMPGGFGYRLEADVASGAVELTDAYLAYKASPQITLTLGHFRPFWGIEEQTSDLFTSFQERAPFTQAFDFERRVGLGAAYSDKTLLVQAGVFTDDAEALLDTGNNSFSVDGRVVFMPQVGGGTLHLGGSAHYRELNNLGTTVRYRARPFLRTTDLRFVDTRNFTAEGERTLGAELAWVKGRFHAVAESSWLTALRPGAADPTFNGGYAEAGLLLTDDVTTYKNGSFERIRPKRPLGSGGLGALKVNLRYTWLDLNDAGIVGGRQQSAGVSLIWIPTDYVRFMVNYGHMWIDDAALAATNGSRSYNADAVGVRAQFDF